ncbi:hypothetical protein HYH03_014524 [Edaphochlamys debaryana]|uniref:Protein kinase domain-containing protein n=1 Tax=Edaphochlamys debaryana TaxID=47281 RepID=A0A835XMY1_9CHLO|nr:hypothetical protein HYH03_014524 [Edaphochlamys debaryana]|eukprot:KAG2486841.1 hypothetical protein HYH03_014524 [Edaphochlamys debaryana]
MAHQVVLKGITLTSKELGRGSYGVVLEGSFRGLRVAVKVMVAPHLDKPALRELLLGPSVTHPNVVQTYTSRCATMTDDFFDYLEGGPRGVQEPGLPRLLLDIPLQSGDGFGAPGLLDGGVRESTTALCRVLSDLEATTKQVAIVLVQELADVGTLRTAIVNNMFTPGENWSVRLARRSLLRTATEIARGVLHLHDAGVVHADLKPANVLLAASPQDRRGFTAKVSDFGLSHVIPPNANSESFAGRLSFAVDTWAFGVILWEMLTGGRPFEGKSQADAVAAIRLSPEPLPWPTKLPMSSGIVHLGRVCMHRDPAQRPDMERVMQVLVGMEQCIRANLLLGPEAVMEILAGHRRDEDVDEIVQRLVAAATAAAAAAPGAQGQAPSGGVPQAVGPAGAQAAAMVQRQGSAVKAEATQEPCAGTPERSLVIVDGIAVLAV